MGPHRGMRLYMSAGLLFAAASVGGSERRPSAELLRFMGGGARDKAPPVDAASPIHVVHVADAEEAAPPPPPPPPPVSPPAAPPTRQPRRAKPAPDSATLGRFMGGGSAGPSKRPALPLQQPPAAPPTLKPEQHNNAGAQPGASECDLRRVDARTLTQDEFRADYQGREPLLLTHAASSWAAVASWATPSLITAAHGDVELQLQDPQLLTKKGTFAPMVSVLPLADYLENLSAERQPFFRNRWHSLTDRVLADVNFSSVPTRSVRSHHILSLGGVGTGVGFHSHSESWLAQIQGRKFWSLARSLGPGWQTKHGCEWATQASASKNGASKNGAIKKGASKNGGGGDDEPWYLEMMGLRERPLHQCVVDPGDAIYIPTGWYHSTCSTLAILSYTPSLLLPLPPLAPFSCAPSS